MRSKSRLCPPPVSVLIVGIGGYGFYYLKTLLEEVPAEQAKLCGVVDPYAERSGHYPWLQANHIPVFEEIEAFYRAGNRADLAVIASPIQFHVPQSRFALSHGTHVLCDKPIAAVVQEADALIRTEHDSDAWCMIGYQWSFSRAIQKLKGDIRKGRFGSPVRMRTLIFWPRDDAYYHRNQWAGRIRDARGQWVLDSPANNAMAHYLHNLLYLLGPEVSTSGQPEEVSAELYRVNPIENYDTVACRIRAAGGTELLFYATHATCGRQDPVFQLEFEQAVIHCNAPAMEIVVRTQAGESWSYGSPENDSQFKKLFDAIHAAAAGDRPVCGPQAARAQCVCSNGMQDSAEEIALFPSSFIRRDQEKARWFVEGLDHALSQCYLQHALPSEIGIPWARCGQPVDLRNYVQFPSGICQPSSEKSKENPK
jgi:predicted dehydrogenase